MRRPLMMVAALSMTIATAAAPAAAHTNVLTPLPTGTGHWLAGDGAGQEVAGSSGTARVNHHGATITVKATGLTPGHAFTMWVAYFNDGTACTFGSSDPDFNCGLGDLVVNSLGGLAYGDGKVIGGAGTATFTARLNAGDGLDVPVPNTVVYSPTEYPDFHVILRSHGPRISGETAIQTHTVDGGCEVEVGPGPGMVGGAIPAAEGECGDVQLFIFEAVPANA